MRRALGVVASVVLAVAVTGCGSDDDRDAAEPTTPPTMTGEPVDEGEDVDHGEEGEEETGADDSGDESEWVVLTDELSGASFALPEPADPVENSAVIEDGSTVNLRNYSAMATEGLIEVGFNVIDSPGESYDFAAGVDGVATTLGGVVVSTTEITVDGNDAVDVEMEYGDDYIVFFQLITTDDHVLQALASGPQDERESVELAYQRLGDSLEVH